MKPILSSPKPAVIVAGPALTVGVIAGVATALIGLPTLLIVGSALIAATVAALWLWIRAPQSTLRAMRAKRAQPGSESRLENVVEGLCTTYGISEPSLHVIETLAVNAAATGLEQRSAHLVVTRGALIALDRLELEAVVARELCEVRRGLDAATVLASVARLPGAKPVISRFEAHVLNDQAVIAADIEAARLTAYPPALAAALKKSAAAPRVTAPKAVAHLWLVDPYSDDYPGGRHPSPSLRVDVLGEL